MKLNKENEMLKRNINMSQGIVIAVGMVLGSGLFSMPGLAVELGGSGVALLAWTLMIVMMVPMLAVFIKLGRAYPQADGLAQYAVVAVAGTVDNSVAGVYAKSAVSVLLCGTFVLGIPSAAWVAAAYTLHAFGVMGVMPTALLTVVFMGLSVLLNLSGVQALARINTVSLYVLLSIIAALVGMNISALGVAIVQVVSVLNHVGSMQDMMKNISVMQLWSVMALLFWSFLGWENMSFGLGELRDPERNVPRVYGWSFALVSVLYVLLALVTSGAAWQGRDVGGATGLLVMFDAAWMRVSFGVTLALMIVSSMNSWLFAASRLVYATAVDGVLPASWARLNTQNTPTTALKVFGIGSFVAIGLLASGAMSVAQLFSLVSQNFMVLYAVSLVAYWRLVWRERRIGAVLIGLAASASCGFLLQGFSVWLLYPLVLLGLGAVFQYRIFRGASV